MGLGYGPRFRGIEALWVGQGEALTRVLPPAPLRGLHPAILDACLHVYPALAEDTADDFLAALRNRRTTFLPVGVERFRAAPSDPTGPLWVHAKRRPGSDAVATPATSRSG
jgi:hypothetical protein